MSRHVAAHIAWRQRLLIAWFGPRGLSSLLLVLLAVFAGVPGGSELVAICSLVVLFSIVVHGFSPLLVAKPAAVATPEAGKTESEYITVEEYRALQASGEPVLAVDARTDRTSGLTTESPANSVRIHPEEVVPNARALRIPTDTVLAVLCA